jgi:formylmethanofuran dehydrogenase subunit E
MIAHITTPSELADFFRFLARFHGHRCPMSILGARLGMAARRHVGRHGENGDVRAVYRNRTCALDGIAAVLGTTLGNGNIEAVPAGEHVLEARNVTHGLVVRLRLTDFALSRGKAYGELRRSGGDPEKMESILREIESAPEALLVETLPAEG